MTKEETKAMYAACYWCDNIVSGEDMIGLLHLDFPRCFILIRDAAEFEFSDYDSWRESIAEINWLDPADKDRYTDEQREDVITKLWNFSVLYDEMNEELYQRLDERNVISEEEILGLDSKDIL